METKLLLAALFGLIFRLALHFHKAYQKTTKKKGARFYYQTYLIDNSTLIVVSIIAAICLHFFVAPYALDYFGYAKFWSPPVALLTASGALEVAELLQLLFMKKVKEKTGVEEEKKGGE